MRSMFLIVSLALSTAGCVSQAEYDRLEWQSKVDAQFYQSEMLRTVTVNQLLQNQLEETRRTIAVLAEQKNPEGFCEEETHALRGALENARADYLAKFDDVTICRYFGTGDHEGLPVVTKLYGGSYVDCSLYTPAASDGYEVTETYFEVDHAVETGKSTLVASY